MTLYPYSVTSTPLEFDDLCYKKNKDVWNINLYNHYGKEGFEQKIVKLYDQIIHGKDTGEDEVCKENLKGVAVVTFQIENDVVQRIKRKQRVTFAGLVSTIGKETRHYFNIDS